MTCVLVLANAIEKYANILFPSHYNRTGHAIRKAVQRLEDTKPKLAARLKKQYSSLSAKAARDSISLPESDGDKKLAAQTESKPPPLAAAPDADSAKDTTGETESKLRSTTAAAASVTDSASLNSCLESSPVEKKEDPKQIPVSLSIADQIAALSSLQGDARTADSASALAFAQAQGSPSLPSFF